MAIPKSKYSDPKHTPGKEFTLDGKDYKGWYVETFNKRYYTGKTISNTSKELIPITSIPKPKDIFVQEFLSPNSDEKRKGSFQRFLVQKINNKKIIEVSKDKFNLFVNKSPYKTAILTWVIKGPAENTFFNGYVYYGAEHKNREAVNRLENTLPGVSSYFKNYSEFVE